MKHSQHNRPGQETVTDAFLAIAERQMSEIKILASRFLSYAIPTDSIEGFLLNVDELRKQFHDATHHCFACRVGNDGSAFRFSDDGEPSGTAGKRILGAIDKRQLTYTGVVVVRYFGGTKLGVGGLARAYTEAADSVLELCTIEKRYLTDTFVVLFPYDMTSQVHHIIDRHGAAIIEQNWLNMAEYTVQIRQSKRQQFLDDLKEATKQQAGITEKN